MRLYKAVKKGLRVGVRNAGTSLGDGEGNYVDLNGESGWLPRKRKGLRSCREALRELWTAVAKIQIVQ